MMGLALATTDRFVLGASLNPAAVGAYHAGYSLSNRTLDVLFAWLGMAGGPAAVAALERGGPAGAGADRARAGLADGAPGPAGRDGAGAGVATAGGS